MLGSHRGPAIQVLSQPNFFSIYLRDGGLLWLTALKKVSYGKSGNCRCDDGMQLWRGSRCADCPSRK
jgi:hypothetical protein